MEARLAELETVVATGEVETGDTTGEFETDDVTEELDIWTVEAEVVVTGDKDVVVDEATVVGELDAGLVSVVDERAKVLDVLLLNPSGV